MKGMPVEWQKRFMARGKTSSGVLHRSMAGGRSHPGGFGNDREAPCLAVARVKPARSGSRQGDRKSTKFFSPRIGRNDMNSCW
jgi:hypothetical protein